MVEADAKKMVWRPFSVGKMRRFTKTKSHAGVLQTKPVVGANAIMSWKVCNEQSSP